MKFRTDFVTNSSSSSYITISIKSRKMDYEGYNFELSTSGAVSFEEFLPHFNDRGLLVTEKGQIIDTCDELISYLSWLTRPEWYEWTKDNPVYDKEFVSSIDYRYSHVRDFSKVGEILGKQNIDILSTITITNEMSGNSAELDYNWELLEPYVPYKKVCDFLVESYKKFKKYKKVRFSGEKIEVPEEYRTLTLSPNDSNTCQVLKEFILRSIHIGRCKGVEGWKHTDASIKESAIERILVNGSLPDIETIRNDIDMGYISKNTMATINLSNCGRLNADVICKDNDKNITIPDGVATIDDNTFSDYKEIENVEIPNSVKNIGNSAFRGCDSLVSVKLKGNNLQRIGRRAFEGCRNLAEFNLPNSLKVVYESAFFGCEKFNTDPIYDFSLITEDTEQKLKEQCESGISLIYKSLSAANEPETVNLIISSFLTNNTKSPLLRDVKSLRKQGENTNANISMLKDIAYMTSAESIKQYMWQKFTPNQLIEMEFRFNIWVLLRLQIMSKDIKNIFGASSATVAKISKFNQKSYNLLTDIEALFPVIASDDTEIRMLPKRQRYPEGDIPPTLPAALMLLESKEDIVHFFEDIYKPHELSSIVDKYCNLHNIKKGENQDVLNAIADGILTNEGKTVDEIIPSDLIQKGNKRIKVMRCLLWGMVQSDIKEITGASSDCITELSRKLKYNKGGISTLQKPSAEYPPPYDTEC